VSTDFGGGGGDGVNGEPASPISRPLETSTVEETEEADGDGRATVGDSQEIPSQEKLADIDGKVVNKEQIGKEATSLAQQQALDGVRDSKFEQGKSLEERRKLAVSFVTEAVNKIGPSVLRIDTETHFLQEEDGVPTPARMPPPGIVQQGQGSGLIFSSDGLVLTNAHV